MAGYSLQPSESFVQKHDGVRHGGFWAQYLDELVLTSQHLVLLKKGVWGNQKGVLVFPLNQIKVFQGVAQALASEQDGSPSLDVYFQNGTEHFGFEKKKDASFWSQKINEVITGNPAKMISRDSTGSEKFAHAVRETTDALKSAAGFGTKPGESGNAAVVPAAGDCAACGAPVTGIRGQAAVCSYCDTATQF